MLASLIGPFMAGCASTPTRESTGQFIDSSLITTEIQARLIADPVTRGLGLSVTTFKGVVRIGGFVKNEREKRRADAIAHGVGGVNKVIDDLKVKPS